MGNKKQMIINNANKNRSILNQIAVLTVAFREKQRRRAQYLRELEKNRAEKQSVSLTDKIIEGVSSFVSYFIPEFLKRQNNINLRIKETDKEMNDIKTELEAKTTELLNVKTLNEAENGTQNETISSENNSENVINEVEQILSEPEPIVNEETAVNEEPIVNEETVVNEETKPIVNEEPKPIVKGNSIFKSLELRNKNK
jgi:hypothetical protein